jgi:Xaa-Pro aminopeptidase
MASDRFDRAKSLLESSGVDAILVSNGTNRRYLTGFSADDHAIDEPAGMALITPNGMVLFAPSTNLPWAEAEANEDTTVREWSSPWTTAVADYVDENGWTRLGFEDATTSVATYNALVEKLDGKTQLVPVGKAVDTLRAVKTDEEIGYLREALRMTDVAFQAAEARARIGMTEKELADIVAEELRNAGSEGESFPTIVASGPNAAKPHHSPGERVLQEGEPIIIDMGALHKGYAGDLTRTIWFGEPSAELVTMYRNVQAAFDSAMAKAGPDITGVQLDAAARDVFTEQGTGQYFVHSLGHGLGLRVHEAPSASFRSNDSLVPGNVVTIEPGLYVPGEGGVRIEDVVLITEDGAENLTGAPKRVL